MRFIQYKIADGKVADADFYTDPVEIASVYSLTIQAHVASGTVKGKAYIEISLDPIGDAPSNFAKIGSGADLTGSANTAVEFQNVAANWVRVHWVVSSSTGTVDVHLKTNGY